MPFEVDTERFTRVRVDVRPSAVLELTWVLTLLDSRRFDHVESLREPGPALRAEIAECVGDSQGGQDCLTDLSILAERIGALLTDEADTFLSGLERAARLDGVGLELRSETPEVRAATLARLERLRRDPGFARQYAEQLGRVWERVRPDWESTGREIVLQACAGWTERLRQGANLLDLVPSKHLVRRPEMEALLRERPRIVLTPMYFTSVGGSIVDMTSFLHIGVPARAADPAELRRKEADLIASRLKVLADGTRVALLRELAAEPASVGDLARRFHLAQPTVSNHVRLLREAGLLDARKDGPRVVYSVPRDQIDRMLDHTRHLLLEH
jgi:DNA-binding transcriptional ArsR family regulator